MTVSDMDPVPRPQLSVINSSIKPQAYHIFHDFERVPRTDVYSVPLDDPLSKIVWSRQPSGDVRSDIFFSQLHTWIHTCLDRHEVCRSEGGNFWETLTGTSKRRELLTAIMPTRVVDVGDDEKSPSLYIPEGATGQWVALSHCWGTHQPLKLESQSIGTFTNAIPQDTMPPLFQDAILITRRMGFRYLWIDSLCILQDSREDWLSESLKMGGIYKNAAFTISAEAAEDCTTGILSSTAKSRVPNRDQQCSDIVNIYARSVAQSIEGVLILVMNSAVKTMPSAQGRLSSRKWVLQEELLSTRLLRFAEGLVWWQCRELQCNERFPYGYRARDNLGGVNNVHIESSVDWTSIKSFALTSRRGRTHKRGNNIMRLVNQQQIRWYWYDTINEYCSRRMTYDTDVLPAISGVAKEFQRQLLCDPSSYRAGIWLNDLPSGLLWFTPRQGATTTASYVAPSWSWASIKSGPYYSQKLLTDLIPDDTLTNFLGPRPKPQAVTNVLEINLIMQQQDPYGQVQGGFMRLKGPCSELCRCGIPLRFLDCYTTTEDPGLSYLRIRQTLETVSTATGQAITSVHILSKFMANRSCVQSADVTHSRCLVIHIVSSKRLPGGHKLAFTLILEQIEDSDDTYRRVGLGISLEDVNSSKVWPTQIVTVI